MHVIRKLLPVGQGAFYVERIESNNSSEQYVSVYDFGSIPKKHKGTGRSLKSIINGEFTKGQKIDRVFISHFHEDHVNGLCDLFDRCDVQRITIPYLTSEEIIFFYIMKATQEEIFNDSTKIFGQLYINIFEGGKEILNLENTLIEYVKPLVGNDRETEDYTRLPHRDTCMVDSLSSLLSGIISHWCYIPYNKKDEALMSKIHEFLQNDQDLKQALNNPFRFIERWKEEKGFRKKIKNLYTLGFPKSNKSARINTSSMILYSGPPASAVAASSPLPSITKEGEKPCKTSSLKCGCLYTGDISLKTLGFWEDIKEKYNSVFPFIGLFQIPHHGSIHSFSPIILTLTTYFFVSAATINQYKHPNKVVRDIFTNGLQANYLWITEQPETKITMEIFFIPPNNYYISLVSG